MEIKINNSKISLIEEEYFRVSYHGKKHRLRFFSITEEDLDGNNLLSTAYGDLDKDAFQQAFWLIKFNLTFPYQQYERQFYLKSLDTLGDEEVGERPGDPKKPKTKKIPFLKNALGIETRYTKYGKPYLRAEERLQFLSKLGEEGINESPIELFLNSTFKDEPYISTGSSFFDNWEGFNQYLLDTVFIEFRRLYLDIPESKKADALEKFGAEKKIENPDYFKRAQLLGEWAYNDLVDKYYKLIYRRIRGDLNQFERRLFLLMYTRKKILHDRIPSEEPRIKEFVWLSRDIFNLCIVYFVYKIKTLGTVNIEKMLMHYYKSFLAAFPIWEFLWSQQEREEYIKKRWRKKHKSLSDKIGLFDERKTTFGDVVPDLPKEEFDIGKFYNLLNDLHSVSEKNKEILRDYLSGTNQTELAKKHSCSQAAISKRLSSIKTEIRKQYTLKGFLGDIYYMDRKTLIGLRRNLAKILSLEKIGLKYQSGKYLRGKKLMGKSGPIEL